MGKQIVLIHGAWVTPLSWAQFDSFLTERGFEVVAPSWPHKDGTVQALRDNPPATLAGLGVTAIVDHYDQIIRQMAEPPILIGHSFGGLFVQMLLDRGLGSAGVAICPAPPKGVLPFLYPSAVRSNLGPLLAPLGWRRVVRMSLNAFRYGFANGKPADEQERLYNEYVVPETGRIFYEGATAIMHNILKVDFNNADRAPLFLIAGAKDNTCPAAQIKSNYRKYRNTKAVTHFEEFPDRTHWIIAEDGWEEVAGSIVTWLDGLNAEA